MKSILALIPMLLLFGCASVTPLQATGGSRSDGVIYMTSTVPYYDMGKAVPVTLDATAAATKRCELWGYTGATPFGGQRSRCNYRVTPFSQCSIYLVTVPFQCTK